MMHTTSLLRTIPRAFYSKEIYREVGREWSGFGFGYLLLVISMFSLPFIVIALVYSFTMTLDKPFDANFIINQIPEITIKNGEISTKVTMPYYIKDKETGKAIAVIDTTRPVIDWSQQMKEEGLILVVGKNQILLNKKPKSGEKTLYDIPENMDLLVTSDTVRGWASSFLGYAWLMVIIVAIVMIFGLFIGRIIVMFFYGVWGKIMNLVLRANLSYTDCVRLASVATTATMALFLLTLIFQINLSVWTYFAVNTIYLFYAIKANKT